MFVIVCLVDCSIHTYIYIIQEEERASRLLCALDEGAPRGWRLLAGRRAVLLPVAEGRLRPSKLLLLLLL